MVFMVVVQSYKAPLRGSRRTAQQRLATRYNATGIGVGS
jgi:hypothetical protein